MIAHDRDTARLLGLSRYKGAPCKHGHAGIRYTGNKACVECDRVKRLAVNASSEHLERERARKASLKRAMRERDPNGYRTGRIEQGRRYRERQRLTLAPLRLAKAAAREQQRAAARKVRMDDALLRQIDLWMRREHMRAGRRERQLAYWRSKQRARRAVMRGAGDSSLTPEQERLAYRLQGGECAYCGEPAEHLDHMHPISRGGRHVLMNVQWLCAPCNLRKKAKTDAEYRAFYGVPCPTKWEARLVILKLLLSL